MISSTISSVESNVVERATSIGVTLSFQPFEVSSLSQVYNSRDFIVKQFTSQVRLTGLSLVSITTIECDTLIVLSVSDYNALAVINDILIRIKEASILKNLCLSFSVKPVLTCDSELELPFKSDVELLFSEAVLTQGFFSEFGEFTEIEYLQAFSNREFIAYAQPLMNLDTGKVRGVELLCRWSHSVRGMILPDVFLPGVQQYNLEMSLDSYMLSEGVKILDSWVGTSKGHLKLSVNVFSRSLDNPRIFDLLAKVAQEKPSIVSKLTIEITETGVIKSGDTSHLNVVKIQSLGYSISLDDLGCGSSNIGYLSFMAPNEIKIDKSLISSVFFGDHNSRAVSTSILKSIIDLVLGMDKVELVVEGIESRDQLDFLKNLGVGIGQGYIYGKPIYFGELETLYLDVNL